MANEEFKMVSAPVATLIAAYSPILVIDKDGQPLPCYGCPNSASGKNFPGRPSGERPCCFCVRNKNNYNDRGEYVIKDGLPKSWYNGGEPLKVPQDNYRSMDMWLQMQKWDEDREKYIKELERRKGIRTIKVD